MSAITPTVGRKVWYWLGSREHRSAVHLSGLQPFDATIVFVHPDGRVNLTGHDHVGMMCTWPQLELRDPRDTDCHCSQVEGVATWMPYQVGQAKREEK